MTTDTSERGLERPAAYGAGWICGAEEDTPDDLAEGPDEAEA